MASLTNFLFPLMLCVCALGAWADDPAPQWMQLLHSSEPTVQTEWGLRYEHGEGVPRDYDRAVQLYCAAARQGLAAAQYQLGWMYANGRGVARDDALAAAWFRLAAAQADVHAQKMLALIEDPSRMKPPACVTPSGVALRVPMGKASNTGRRQLERRQIEAWVYQLAPGYGLDPELVLAVIEAESGFEPAARSPKNAWGLMQLIPETAARFGVHDITDPIQNLNGGMAYLRWLLAFFQGDLRLALAGYNAGERAVERFRGVPPFSETQTYVEKITRSYGRTTHPPVAQVVKPSPVLLALATR